MNYQEARHIKTQLERAHDFAAAGLRDYLTNNVAPSCMGLTPDKVKFSPEYRKVKATFDQSFKELQAFNTFFMKHFKKEYAEERRNKGR